MQWQLLLCSFDKTLHSASLHTLFVTRGVEEVVMTNDNNNDIHVRPGRSVLRYGSMPLPSSARHPASCGEASNLLYLVKRIQHVNRAGYRIIDSHTTSFYELESTPAIDGAGFTLHSFSFSRTLLRSASPMDFLTSRASST